jgi:hypothetical protein
MHYSFDNYTAGTTIYDDSTQQIEGIIQGTNPIIDNDCII